MGNIIGGGQSLANVRKMEELQRKLDALNVINDHFVFAGYRIDGKITIPNEKSAFLFWLKNQYGQSAICSYDYGVQSVTQMCGPEGASYEISKEDDGAVTITPALQTYSYSFAIIM